jgi:predicted HTH transcriptional regulator
MSTTNKLQGTIEQIRAIIAEIGPATARKIETHPEVVAACRSSKAKARRLIERLLALGLIQSTGDAQQPHFWVTQEQLAKPVKRKGQPSDNNTWVETAIAHQMSEDF